FGGATGSLAAGGQVKLTDNAHFINEFYQQFTPGSFLSFTVTLTTKVDPGLTPDVFSFSILDRLLSPVPTTNFADALILVSINSANLAPADLRNSLFAGDPNQAPLAGGDVIVIGRPQVPGVPSVPDTGASMSMLLIGVGAAWCVQRCFVRGW